MAPPWICSTCTYENDADAPKCAMCDATRVYACARCHETIRHGPRVMANGHTYHRGCFQCTACHEPFTTPQFQLKDGDPYHLECYKTLFLPRCEVCDEFIPMNAAGNVVYKLVPFWDMKYCPTHDDRFRCCSCQRIEPLDPRNYFEILSDGRKTCHDCAMTVVLDTNEAQTLVKEVWQFMESIGISLPYIPVYLVEYSTLNDHRHSSHGGDSHDLTMSPASGGGFVTRGLCLSEVTEIQHLVHNGRSHVPQVARLETNRSVSAILILHGLPYDLTAQVLAHEATHAFIKLQSGFPRHIEPMVEEGVCQLISYLWLKYKHVVTAERGCHTATDSAFNTRLREFYMHQIEHDASPVYGDGFRRALDAYERTHSLQRLVDCIRAHGSFP